MKKTAVNQIEDAIQIVENALTKLKDLKDGKTEVKLVRTGLQVNTWVHKKKVKGMPDKVDKIENEVMVTYGKYSYVHIEHTICEDDIDKQID